MEILAQLPHCFEEHNGYRRRKIKAPRRAHRNSDAIVDVCGQQAFRQPLRFATENKKIAAPKLRVPVGALRLGRQIKIAGAARLSSLQFGKGFPRA